MRLIDADKAHDTLTDLYKYAKREARRAYSAAIDIVANADTIEAEPVRHGRCEPDGEGYSRCTVCNEHESSLMYYRYCPNCGAKMDGDE